MSNLTIQIPPQGHEVIRDRIGEILTDEIANQIVLGVPAELNAEIFVERIVPIAHTDTPLINILYSRGDFDNNNSDSSDGKHTFSIDVYTTAKAKVDEPGDSRSVFIMHRIVGLIRAILEDSSYITLGFVAPFIMRTTVTQIQIVDPRNNQDATNLMMGRLTFVVEAAEVTEQKQPRVAEGYDTKVTLEETDKGFVYVLNN